jgi:hypothetical protein
MKFRFPQISSAVLERIELLLLFLLFLSCSTSYRITAGGTTIGLAEIAAWVYILWRWAAGGEADKETERDFRWMIRGLRFIAVWAGILWCVSLNWNARREMFLDWVLALLVFSCLLRSPVKDSRRLAFLVILAALPNALLGAVQHVLGIGLAPKDFSGWSENAAGLPVYGFFGHPNDLAVYLYWPFLICIVFIFTGRKAWRALFFILAGLFGAVLYQTISRSTLLTLAAVAVVLAVLVLLPRKKPFLLAMTAGAGAGAAALAWFLSRVSFNQLNLILSGRLLLWKSTLHIISKDLLYLPAGYLFTPPANILVFWIPHNIYLLSWMQFGWLGIPLLAGWGFFFLSSGWNRYERLRRHPVAAVLWVGLAGLFLVNGIVSLYFHEPYVIVNFICVSALWAALVREVDRSPVPAAAGSP